MKLRSLYFSSDYCFETLEPLTANKNNATIAEHIVKPHNLLNAWCEEEDIMIINRAFIDIVEIFSDFSYASEMLVYLRKGQKQHTTEESNES